MRKLPFLKFFLLSLLILTGGSVAYSGEHEHDKRDGKAPNQANSRNLVGSSWYVIAYNNGKQAVVNLLGDTHITMHFGENGRMIGSTGCNKYLATYKTADTSVTIMQPEPTQSICARPKGIMEQETRFLELLSSVATFRLDGSRLHLRTLTGAIAMTLVRATPAPSAG